jgi:8-oxo-dGTP diphosphatase
MKTLIVTAAVIMDQGKVLITQRRRNSPHGLLWEFPGGKVQEGEEPREALRRELKEELGIETRVGMIFEVIYHFYPEWPILLLVYRCRIEKGTPTRLGCRDLRWVDFEELKGLPMPAADGPIRNRLFLRVEKMEEDPE